MSCPQQSCSQNSRFDKSNFLYRESNARDAKRYDILYGVDPLSANILDRSIARTWPISSWSITVSTNNTRLQWYPTLTYHPTAGQVTILQDYQSSYSALQSNIWRYGGYMITMNVQASTTSTQSDKLFTQYIKVAEFEPFANFWATSAKTVSSSFVANNISISSQLVSISSTPNANLYDNLGSCFEFVSGYAPNLTVYFVDSSNAHTFPIESYHWDFGDPYNEGPDDITSILSNYYTVTNTQIVSGAFESPCWKTNTQGHSAVHTYIMPGTYNVSLTVQASCTNTSDICARYINTSSSNKRFYIYVEEILPTCNSPIYASVSTNQGFVNTTNGVSGHSPVTIYFNASSIIAGSFPICRIDWDFGDDTTQTVTRYPLTNTTTQGLSVLNISAYSYDLDDPRNFVIPHIYTNNSDSLQSYNINISAYACNTNSMIHCSALSLVSPIIPPMLQAKIDTKRLIGSRFDEDGNIIYIIEGQADNTTYTIALSGELN